ncbi:3326_t:CDS:2, partial [Funneliformis geosporum]
LIAAHSEGLLFAINDNNLWEFLSNIDSNNSNKKNIQIPANAHNLIKGGNTLLHKLIPKRYKEFATDLRKYSLLLIEQLSYSHGRSIFTFANLSVYQNTPHIGRIPTWFIKLQEQLLNSIKGDLHQKFPHSKECYFDFAQPKKIP